MTFADGKVKKALGEFALVWKNIAGEPGCGESFEHAPDEPAGSMLRGNGEHNTQMLFLTPEGKLVHVLAGWCSPKDLVAEIAFVRKHLKSDAKALAAAHREQAKASAPGEFGGRDWWEKRGKKRGHDYMAKHTLLAFEKFKAEDLVGDGKSFFGSRRGVQ